MFKSIGRAMKKAFDRITGKAKSTTAVAKTPVINISDVGHGHTSMSHGSNYTIKALQKVIRLTNGGIVIRWHGNQGMHSINLPHDRSISMLHACCY